MLQMDVKQPEALVGVGANCAMTNRGFARTQFPGDFDPGFRMIVRRSRVKEGQVEGLLGFLLNICCLATCKEDLFQIIFREDHGPLTSGRVRDGIMA